MPSDEALKAARDWNEHGTENHCTEECPCRWCSKLAAAFDAFAETYGKRFEEDEYPYNVRPIRKRS